MTEKYEGEKYMRVEAAVREIPRLPKDVNGHYAQTIRRIYDAGATLATPEIMRHCPNKLINCPFGTSEKFENHGFVVMDNHERTKPIEAFIDCEVTKFIKSQKEGGTIWLMPVFDDQEYIGWTFVFFVGDEETVIRELEKLSEEVTEETTD